MTQFHSLAVAECRRETAEAVSVVLHVPDSLRETFRYEHGQHLTLRHYFNGEEERRNYSICSSVDEQILRFVIKKLPGGRFSSYANQQLKAGDFIDAFPPTGSFNVALVPEQARNYLAVAAGSGITPVFSIIKTILESEPQSRVWLVYGNRDASSILLLEALEDLKNRFHARFSLIHILSREAQDLELFSGRIDRARMDALLDQLIPARQLDHCFLCGPLPLVEYVRASLLAHGLEPPQIHFELFSSPRVGILGAEVAAPERQLSADEAEQLSEVVLILDGKRSSLTLKRGAEPVLGAALKVRGDMPFACRSGVCCTCRAKVLEGELEMDACYGLEPDEIKAGFVLTCQAHPVSEKVVLDYDAR